VGGHELTTISTARQEELSGPTRDGGADSARRWKTWLAFATIYLVWGSTFLAIRIGVREVPPFLFAAMRFLLAGLVLYGWTIVRGEPSPDRREWLSALFLALLIFVLDYGLLFWAEQRVPSGIAAVMLATTPVFMALSEITILRTPRLTGRLVVGLLVGIGGVAVLMSDSLGLGGVPIDRAGSVALIIAAMSWSVASMLTRKLPLPSSKVMSSGAQMLGGGRRRRSSMITLRASAVLLAAMILAPRAPALRASPAFERRPYLA
jgi:drug/metabolite transporter (DMT)-like permease